jgi:hypothetical protein
MDAVRRKWRRYRTYRRVTRLWTEYAASAGVLSSLTEGSEEGHGHHGHVHASSLSSLSGGDSSPPSSESLSQRSQSNTPGNSEDGSNFGSLGGGSSESGVGLAGGDLRALDAFLSEFARTVEAEERLLLQHGHSFGSPGPGSSSPPKSQSMLHLGMGNGSGSGGMASHVPIAGDDPGEDATSSPHAGGVSDPRMTSSSPITVVAHPQAAPISLTGSGGGNDSDSQLSHTSASDSDRDSYSNSSMTSLSSSASMANQPFFPHSRNRRLFPGNDEPGDVDIDRLFGNCTQILTILLEWVEHASLSETERGTETETETRITGSDDLSRHDSREAAAMASDLIHKALNVAELILRDPKASLFCFSFFTRSR